MIGKRTLLKRLLTQLCCGALLVPVMAGLSACSEHKASFNAIDVTGADYAHDFSLPDHNGVVRHLADFRGKVVVLFFGYTQCPDVCPTSMTDLAAVKTALGKDGARLQVLFVTVDPARDTPAVLKAYMENFDPGFLALRAPPEQLPALAKNFKIYYQKVEGRVPDSYTMDHSAGSYVYDTQGHLRLFARYGGGPAPMTSDIQTLLREAG